MVKKSCRGVWQDQSIQIPGETAIAWQEKLVSGSQISRQCLVIGLLFENGGLVLADLRVDDELQLETFNWGLADDSAASPQRGESMRN